MVHPYLRRRTGHEPVTYPSEAVRERAGAHARRADLPGAGDAARDRRRRLHAGRGGCAAARDGRLEAHAAALEHFKDKLIDGMRARGYSEEFAQRIYQPDAGLRRIRLSGIARARASRCWCTTRHGSSITSRRLSPARCSTASRWASTRRRSWCAMRASMASKCGRWMCRRAIVTARSSGARMAKPALRLGLRLVKSLSEEGAQRIVGARGASAVRERAGSRRACGARSPRSRSAGRGGRARGAERQSPSGVLGGGGNRATRCRWRRCRARGKHRGGPAVARGAHGRAEHRGGLLLPSG